MYITIGELIITGENEKTLNVIDGVSQEEINQIEYDNQTLNIREHIKMLRDTSIKNGNELKHFLYLLRNNHDSIQGLSDMTVIEEGNRLLLNFLSSFGTFLDITNRKISKSLGKEIQKKFDQDDKQLYDKYFHYRFLKRLRNFTIHYDSPFTAYRAFLNDKDTKSINIFLDRDHLLEYDGWSKVKKEIKKLDKEIDIYPMIDTLVININILYFQFLYYFSKDLISALNNMNSFIKSKKIKTSPCLLVATDIDAYKQGKISLRPINPEDYLEIYSELKKHPNIIINENR